MTISLCSHCAYLPMHLLRHIQYEPITLHKVLPKAYTSASGEGKPSVEDVHSSGDSVSYSPRVLGNGHVARDMTRDRGAEAEAGERREGVEVLREGELGGEGGEEGGGRERGWKG
eukprot:2350640-Rhodomonas_salina.1